MKNKYLDWIYKNIHVSYGKCEETTLWMNKEFPELTRVRGHYYCPIWGERTHWWLVDPDGEIVDPTVDQFPSKGFGVYEEWTEGDEEPTGKCPNCGEYCYNGSSTCSDKCYTEYASYLNSFGNQ